jgi:hypothetical protein
MIGGGKYLHLPIGVAYNRRRRAQETPGREATPAFPPTGITHLRRAAGLGTLCLASYGLARRHRRLDRPGRCWFRFWLWSSHRSSIRSAPSWPKPPITNSGRKIIWRFRIFRSFNFEFCRHIYIEGESLAHNWEYFGFRSLFWHFCAHYLEPPDKTAANAVKHSVFWLATRFCP